MNDLPHNCLFGKKPLHLVVVEVACLSVIIASNLVRLFSYSSNRIGKTIKRSINHTKNMPQLSDEPKPSSSEIGYGSDAIVEQLSRLDLKYIAIVPGSSFRGLHDSLVNYKGNASPEILVCLHEEHAVSIAHGWAKVTGRPM